MSKEKNRVSWLARVYSVCSARAVASPQNEQPADWAEIESRGMEGREGREGRGEGGERRIWCFGWLCVCVPCRAGHLGLAVLQSSSKSYFHVTFAIKIIYLWDRPIKIS